MLITKNYKEQSSPGLTLCDFEDTQGQATPRKPDAAGSRTKPAVCKQFHRGATYQKVLDARKRPIRGLWICGSRYYARISVEDLNMGQKEIRRVSLDIKSSASGMRLPCSLGWRYARNTRT